MSTGLYGDEWWRENLRMTRDTFKIVCSNLTLKGMSPDLGNP